MDTWKFYDITHREHLVCNPMSEAKLARLLGLLCLQDGATAVDIAAGKGELMVRLAELYGVRGVGVDISPYCVADARQKLSERAPDADVTFIELDGAQFRPERLESFDLVSCIGASWIFGGHEGTLKALTRMAVPGGWVVVGEPYWLQEPSEEYIEASGDHRDDFGTHVENVETGERLGLRLVFTLVSNKDDWDQYEGLQWHAADQYARTHPDDPDVPELIERVSREKAVYLKWGRETLGWAIYVFRRPLNLAGPGSSAA